MIPEGLKARVATTVLVNWFNLDEYLRGKYQCQGTHLPLECGNDTDFHIQPEETERPYDEWDKALEKYKNGDMEEYYMSAVISAAVRDGHLPFCEYVITVSW